jgi:hypothetical protein
MAFREFFLGNPANAAAGLVAVGLFAGGAAAVAGGAGVAGVLSVVAGFVAMMFLEYRHIEGGD